MKAEKTDVVISVKSFINKIGADRLYTYSATSAFFIIMAIFPFLILLLTIVHYTPITQDYLVSKIDMVVPEVVLPVLHSIIDEIYGVTRGGAVITVSAIGALWSASKGVMSIIRGVNVCFNIRDKRNYLVVRLLSCLYTFVLILFIIFLLVMFVFGSNIYAAVKNYIGPFADMIYFIMKERFIISTILLTLFFMLIYSLLPVKKQHFFRMFPGAFIAALAVMGISVAASLYVKIFPNFAVTYGSLDSFVLVMLWLYFIMYIVFICGEINHFVNILFERRRIKKMQNKALKYEQKKVIKEERSEHRREVYRGFTGRITHTPQAGETTVIKRGEETGDEEYEEAGGVEDTNRFVKDSVFDNPMFTDNISDDRVYIRPAAFDSEE